MQDILIAGAGPVGLTAAVELARYGVPLRIIDRSPHPTTTSKALVVWSRTLELMDRIGCTQTFLDAGLRAHSTAMHHGGTTLGRTSFDGIGSPYNFALMIPQSETERLLTEQLAQFGVKVERQVELLGFEETEGGVRTRLRHPDGREEAATAPWLIGCDGAHSTVRHGLGVAFEGSAQDDDWLLADVRLTGDTAPPQDEIAVYLHHAGPLVVFPIPGGRARVIATTGKTDPAHPPPEPTLAEVQALVDARAGGFYVLDPVWLANFRINERKVARYGTSRVLLAGDAAHVHSPAGGQGMNTGMQDAINLAWKLALVARGQAAETLLHSYSPERSAVGDMVLRNATRMTDMATLANPAAQMARNLALRALLGTHVVRDKLANTMSETEIAYPASPISTGHGAGTRLAPEQYDGPPPGTGKQPRFVLYAADHANAASLTAKYPGLLETGPRKPPTPNEILIVRPDAYVGFASTHGSWDAPERYLQQLSC